MSHMTIVMEEGMFMIHVYTIPLGITFTIKKWKISLVRLNEILINITKVLLLQT
jgi:hypothetical protein